MKRKYLKQTRAFSLLLAVLMLLSLLPITAVAAAPTSYIALTSDVHGSDSNLQSWLTNLKNNGTTSLDYFIFGGDYPAWGSEPTASTNAKNYRTLVKNTFNDVPVVLTRGNHDTSGNYGDPYDKGAQYNGSDFAVYVMPAYQLDGVSSGVYGGQGFTTAAMNDLDLFLSNIGLSKPVFVASHFPIHYFSSRTSTNASEMIDLLNKYPNVIFVYGHNHTLSDTNYKLVKTAGDSIQYTSGSATKAINFTYTACGGMMDGANQDIRALLVSLTDNGNTTTVKLQHQNVAGLEMTSKTITLNASGGTTPGPDPDPDPNPGAVKYELATSIEEGGQYVIVAESSGSNYALTTTANGSNLAGGAVTVSGDTLVAASVNADTMLWTFTADGSGYNVMNSGKYLARTSGGSSGLSLSATDTGSSYTDWIRSGTSLYVRSSSGSNYNLRYSATSGAFQASTTAGEVRLYKLTSGGTAPDPDPDPNPGTGDYVLASSIEEGGQYIIVAKSGSNSYALTTDTAQTNYLAAQQVTVSGNTISAGSVNAAKMVWTFTSDGSGYDVKNGANYLNRASYTDQGNSEGLFISATESGSAYSDWIYSGNKLYVYSTNGSTDFNMILGSGNGYFQASSSSSQEIYLYKLTSGGTTPGPDPDPDPNPGTVKYELATTIESGSQYVIVAENSGSNYALTTTASGSNLAGGAVTVSGDTLVAASVNADTMLWTFTADGSGYNVMNSGKYLARTSGNNYLNLSATDTGASYTDWIRSGTNLSVRSGSGSSYYLVYSGSSAAFQASTTAGAVKLYKLTSGGTAPDPDPDPDPNPGTGDYELASSIEEGEQYIIVAKSGSNSYALTTTVAQTNYLAAQQVTVNGNTIAAGAVDSAKMVWTFTADGSGYDVKNGANYLNRDTGSGGGNPEGIFVSATESGASYSDWIYSGNKLYVHSTSGNTDFNMILGSGNSYFQASSSSSQEIYLYKLTSGGTTPDPVTLTGIVASFEQDDNVIYPTAGLDALKDLLTVTAAYSDGSNADVEDYILSGELTVGESTITVTYEDKTATFTVAVTAVPVVLDSITITTQPSKVTYTKGETLSLAGMVVTAAYSDGSNSVVTEYMANPASGTVLNTVGTQTIVVSYAENGVTETASVNITVNEVVITQHTVTFSPNNETPDTNVTVSDGDLVAEPTAPEKSGYTFLGWFLNDELFDFETPISTTITLHAQWAEIVVEYTVSFDADNGSSLQTTVVRKGDSVASPADPTKNGFIFSGWYDGDTLFDFNSSVNENLALKAKWTAIPEGVLISAPAIESARGLTISVPVRIEKNPGLVAVQVVVEYDPSVLTPVGFSNGAIWKSDLTSNLNYASNQVLFVGASSTLMTGDGEIAVIDFEVKPDAAYGEYLLEIDVQELNTLYGSTQQNVPFTKADGKVNIAAYKIGDINNDGEIRASDATEILLYVAQMKPFTDLQLLAADVNGDGKVTSADATEILLIVARLKDPPSAMSPLMQPMSIFAVMSAEAKLPVKLEIGSSTGEIGDIVTLPVTISENTGMSTFTFHIKYDATKLIPVGADVEKDWTAEITSNLTAVDLETGEPIIILTSARGSNWTKTSGTIAEISFRVLGTETGGDADVNLMVQDLCYVDGADVKNLSCEVTNGTITVPAPAHTHSYTSVVTAPTCEAQGFTTYTCACGDSYKDAFTNALGHNWGTGVITAQPTEYTDGTRTFTCSHCGETKTENIPALGHTHSYTSVVTTPTCEAQGFTTYTCTCGDSYKDVFTNALGHNWGGWTVTTAATCETAGLEARVCTHDAQHKETRVIPASGHSWGAGVITTQPTYTSEGVRTYTCAWCGETRTESIPRLISSGYSNEGYSGESYGGGSEGSGSTDEVVEVEEDETALTDLPVENPFGDVLSDAWYYNDVMWAYSNGLMNGTASDKFSPNAKLTRAMIVTILWRLEGSPETEEELHTNFADVVQGAYYESAVSWAAKNEIIFGYGEGLFGPNDDITREQLATILWRYAQYKGMDVSSGENTNILSYNDALAVGEYAIPAMQWACAEGIITGKPGGILDAKGGATRAESAAMLHRFVNAMEETQP